MFSLPGPDPGRRGLAAPCPRRRWLQAWSGQEGSQHRATRSKFGAATGVGIAVRAGHPPLCKGSCKSSGGEALPALPLQRSFAYTRLGKERSFMVAVQKS